MKFTIRAKMWYSGIAVTMTSSPGLSASGMKALNCSVLAIRLRWDSAAPFDRPVVPPVYCKNTRSSPASATGENGSAAPWASASARATAPASRGSIGGLGSSLPLPSPTPTVITFFTPVPAMTSATVAETPL